jgi:hypothetical protein
MKLENPWIADACQRHNVSSNSLDSARNDLLERRRLGVRK